MPSFHLSQEVFRNNITFEVVRKCADARRAKSWGKRRTKEYVAVTKDERNAADVDFPTTSRTPLSVNLYSHGYKVKNKQDEFQAVSLLPVFPPYFSLEFPFDFCCALHLTYHRFNQSAHSCVRKGLPWACRRANCLLLIDHWSLFTPLEMLI